MTKHQFKHNKLANTLKKGNKKARYTMVPGFLMNIPDAASDYARALTALLKREILRAAVRQWTTFLVAALSKTDVACCRA